MTEKADIPLSKEEANSEEEKRLEQLALEELLNEAQKGAVRANEYGPMGWNKQNIPRPQQRFLCNTLRDTVQSNRRKERSKRRERSRSKSKSPKRKHKREDTKHRK